jgi:hypothetical protein
MLQLAGMVKRPFVSWVTQRIWAFDSRCSVFLHPGKNHAGNDQQFTGVSLAWAPG